MIGMVSGFMMEGLLLNRGIHYIDLLCYFFGGPSDCVSSVSNKSNKLQAEDTHLGLIKFKNGVVCQVSLTTALRPTDFQATIEVFQKENRQASMGYVVTKLILIIITQKKKRY